jgi:AhpD family alkylhydroperoxidase
MRSKFRHAVAMFAATTLVSALAGAASAQQPAPAANATYRDIEATLGIAPGFFKAFPEIAGAWEEFKSVQSSPEAALPVKMTALIGLAVASQIPCAYCVYFQTAAARANGATDDEVREAIAMASVTRHWSTVLNSMRVDLTTFKAETDRAMRLTAESNPGE